MFYRAGHPRYLLVICFVLNWDDWNSWWLARHLSTLSPFSQLRLLSIVILEGCRTSYMGLAFPRASIPKDKVGSCKVPHLVWEITQHHFYNILLVIRESQGQTDESTEDYVIMAHQRLFLETSYHRSELMFYSPCHCHFNL